MGGIIGGCLGALILIGLVVFFIFRVRRRRALSMRGISSNDYPDARSTSFVPSSPRPSSPRWSMVGPGPGPGPAPTRVGPIPTQAPRLSLTPNMTYAAGGTRSELFPSMISVSDASISATPISPMPSPGSFSDQPRPHMRETMVNTAGASIVQGGRGHSSLSADAMLDPFVDPVPPAVKVTDADSDANPFADPQPSGAPVPASTAVQRLSVASTISVDVQVSDVHSEREWLGMSLTLLLLAWGGYVTMGLMTFCFMDAVIAVNTIRL